MHSQSSGSPILKVLAGLVVAGGGALWIASASTGSTQGPSPLAALAATAGPTAPPAPAAVPTVDTFCAGAVDAVKAYKAPGQRDTVDDLVVVGILADRRPHQLGGWRPAKRASNACQVMYGANIGNAPAVFIWTYTPATGTVDTSDGDTKRLLGWR